VTTTRKCCRDIDPVEDTERPGVFRLAIHGNSVAGISIRLRILKGKSKREGLKSSR